MTFANADHWQAGQAVFGKSKKNKEKIRD